MVYSVFCIDINDTEKLAKKFADIIIPYGAFVCLFGEVGAGKTAFTKLVCKYLEVKEKMEKEGDMGV